MRYRVSRRDFIRTTALAAGALPLSRFGAFSPDRSGIRRMGAPKRVIVIGAGLAGLSATYELTEAGHDVSVLEAQMRQAGAPLPCGSPSQMASTLMWAPFISPTPTVLLSSMHGSSTCPSSQSPGTPI